ncbi:MAG: hypothetical protein KBD06_00005 [Candidatus Pacebacteria bacterium]|nr:hypothetical protein [Candidatus Paceibacterota bacterium]
MVTTRGTATNVEFVLGNEQIDRKALSAKERVAIVRAIINDLPIKYMRAFKSLNQILAHAGTYSPERFVPFAILDLPIIGGGARKTTRVSDVYLSCSAMEGDFPNGQLSADQWYRAPRLPSDLPHVLGELAPIAAKHLLLGRNKCLYQLDVTWIPKVTWEEKSMSSTPEEFWYELDAVMKLKMLDDSDLEGLFQENEFADATIFNLNQSLSETINDAEGQVRHLANCRAMLHGRMERLSMGY